MSNSCTGKGNHESSSDPSCTTMYELRGDAKAPSVVCAKTFYIPIPVALNKGDAGMSLPALCLLDTSDG